MRNIICPTRLLHPDAKPPAQSKPDAAGYDICCVAGLAGLEKPEQWSDDQRAEWAFMNAEGQLQLAPGESALFRTGFAQAIDPDYACFLWDRSGMGAIKCIGRLAGVIDPDYRGEWFVRLVNHSNVIVTIKVGDKIVQGVYQERVVATCPIVDELPSTERGSKGFGSTDSPRERTE